jgi:hypothetical protein
MNDKLLLLLMPIVNAGFGLFVYFKNPKHLVNRLFAGFVLSVSAWTFCAFMILTATDISRVQAWGKIVFIPATLIALSFFYFSSVFPDRRSIQTGRLFWLFTILGIIIALMSPSKLMVSSVELAEGSTQANPVYKPELGPASFVFSLYLIGCLGSGLLTLARKWRTSRGIHRLQIQYLFLGVLLFSLCAASTNLLLPKLGIVRYGVYGPFFSVFMIILTAHAIVRYRLMDIHLVFQKSLVYLVSIVAVAGVCLAWVFGFRIIEQVPPSSIAIILLLDTSEEASNF